MSSLLELIQGDGRADTVVRAVVLALLLAVSAALVWTTVASRVARPAPERPTLSQRADGVHATAGGPLLTQLH